MASRIDKAEVLARVDVRAFFSEYFQIPSNKREVMVVCPYHADTTPSLSINLETGMWNCHACDAKGDVFTWIMKQEDCQFSEALRRLAVQVGLLRPGDTVTSTRREHIKPQAKPEPKLEPIPDTTVHALHSYLIEHPILLDYLTKERGLTLDTIKTYEIGYSENRKRYTLPVRDAAGKCQNIRFYMPNPAEGLKKMESWKTGYGSVRLYPNDALDTDTIVLTEGEWDCLLARQNGFPALTATGGAESFPTKYCSKFKGKDVHIVYDIDQPGKAGALKTARLLEPYANTVRICNLPITEPANGDVSDFFVRHNKTADDFKALLDEAPAFKNGKTMPGPKDFRKLIPPSSFLDMYIEAGSDTTDAPVEFHLAVGLSVLSAVIGNNVYFTAWGTNVYPNLWTILLAPSGFFRKSTSMKLGLKLVSNVTPEHILANDFTQERMIENLADREGEPPKARGIIPVWEFGAMLKQLGKDYNSSLKEFLTEIYDTDHYIRETKGGRHEIKNPALSILAGTTIDWILANSKTDDFRSGFFARFLFWPAVDKNGWKGLGESSCSSIWDTLRYLLHDIKDIRGQATFAKPVLEKYNAWLRTFEAEVNNHKLPTELQGFYTRLATYVLKFAVLYEISQTQTLEISVESLDYAVKLAEYLKSHLIELITEDMVGGKDANDLRVIKRLVKEHEGIDRQTLLRRSHMMTHRLTELLTTLLQTGELKEAQEKTSGRPRQTFYTGHTSQEDM